MYTQLKFRVTLKERKKSHRLNGKNLNYVLCWEQIFGNRFNTLCIGNTYFVNNKLHKIK